MDIKILEINSNNITSNLELLIELRMETLKEVFSPIKDTISDSMWDTVRNNNLNYYKNAISNNEHFAYIAYLNEEVVGCGGMCISKELPSPDNVDGTNAYIMNIYTKPEYRRRGIGKNICKTIISKAKNLNISKIYLESSDMAKSLYASLGFTKVRDYMKLGKLFSEEMMDKLGVEYM